MHNETRPIQPLACLENYLNFTSKSHSFGNFSATKCIRRMHVSIFILLKFFYRQIVKFAITISPCRWIELIFVSEKNAFIVKFYLPSSRENASKVSLVDFSRGGFSLYTQFKALVYKGYPGLVRVLRV